MSKCSPLAELDAVVAGTEAPEDILTEIGRVITLWAHFEWLWAPIFRVS